MCKFAITRKNESFVGFLKPKNTFEGVKEPEPTPFTPNQGKFSKKKPALESDLSDVGRLVGELFSPARTSGWY